MSAFTVAAAKEADEKLIYLVFGFIRTQQDKQHGYRSSRSRSVIPTDICYLCVLFLMERDQFEVIGDQVQVSRDKLTITKLGSRHMDWDNTSYTKNWIAANSKRIVSWKVALKFESSLCVGISSRVDCVNKDFSFKSKGYFCAVSHYACCYQSGAERVNVAGADKRLRYKSGDCITLTLNLQEAIVTFRKNEGAAHVLWQKIVVDQEELWYKFAISLPNYNDSATLLAFDEH